MKRKKPASHANHERWLVSYADFITLLFAFFVVMFSAAQVDKKRVSELALSVELAFNKLGLTSISSPRPTIMPDPMPFDHEKAFEQAVRNSDPGFPTRRPVPLKGDSPVNVDMAALMRDLESALKPQIQRHEAVIRLGREGIVISLREIGFFDSGSAEIKLKSEPAVMQIAEILKARPNSIRIEGHTDNVPIHNQQFTSNWELSTARATEMIALFISRYGLPPARLSASGYAEFHPVASNETWQGRAENRRVDIVVLNVGGE